MNAASILQKLRHDTRLSSDEIRWFANGLADGSVSDAQAGAFAMGVCARGLGDAGRSALTAAMRDSGDVLRWDLPGPVIDKHSTGGIGDAVSLVLAPALAALGAYVPMISGRGLGHTGGTLDKLEALSGLTTELNEAAFRGVVDAAGCAIAAASGDVAPADRRLYAVRDVTGTVESLDLITASILSKKLAAGVGALVLDVKLGSGAFQGERAAADALARVLVTTAEGAGCPCKALITDMNQPVLPSIGNALEVAEVRSALVDPQPETRIYQLTQSLGGVLLALAGLAPNRAAGAGQIADVLASGAAADRFAKMCHAMGGRDALASELPRAPVQLPIPAARDGMLTAMDGTAVGAAVVALGGGRRQAGDAIDPAVGLSDVVSLGAFLSAGDPVAMVHARDAESGKRAVAALQGAFKFDADSWDPQPLIYAEVG